jgi:hypothetical protein
MTGKARGEADGRERGNREGLRESRPVVGGKRHSWLLVPRVDIAIIMSIKTNKFTAYEERQKRKPKSLKPWLAQFPW